MRPTYPLPKPLLPRRSYKPNRIIRNRPAPRLNLVFRPLVPVLKSKRMNAKQIESKFFAMGARLKIREIPTRQVRLPIWLSRGTRAPDYAIDRRWKHSMAQSDADPWPNGDLGRVPLRSSACRFGRR